MRAVRLRAIVLLWPLVFASLAAQEIHWVGSWAASQQVPEPQNALAADDLRDATLRQIIHLSIGGAEIRVHVSNAFGTAPLHLTAVHIARPRAAAGSVIDPATDRALTFGGAADVIVPAGAEYISDPIAYAVAALSDLSVSLHFDVPPAQQTGHPGSRVTSYVVHGDQVSAAEMADAKRVEHWYQVSGVDVAAPALAGAIVTLGDSITDGHAATTNGNDRWPDVLARHLQSGPKTAMMGVLNEGIGGNRVLLDGLGPNALARFDRDVLAQPGVRFLIVLEGVNDLGTLTRDREVSSGEHDALVRRILSAYAQMAMRAHAHGIRVIGATILPYTGSDYYHPSAANEADRQAINQWIRSAKDFDAVVDFDRLTRDPEHPERLLPAFDSGDHLHPSPAGYKAMGEAIPLTLFLR
jgi:lysophospholipase L1-like esterase